MIGMHILQNVMNVNLRTIFCNVYDIMISRLSNIILQIRRQGKCVVGTQIFESKAFGSNGSNKHFSSVKECIE